MTEREILHGSGTVIHLSASARFGQDALLLAEFCGVHRSDRLLDLGTGCGILPLALYDRGYRGHCLGLELDAEAAALARRSARENGLADRFIVLETDLVTFRSEEKFDAALCNPPYFALGSGRISCGDYARGARHETACTLSDAARTAAACLKEGGRFAVCYRPERLASLFAALRAAGFAPKRMQFVRHDADSAPWLVLMDARLRGGEGLQLLPDRLTPKKQAPQRAPER